MKRYIEQIWEHMNDPKVIESALNMFNEIIDEFNNVYNS